VLFVQESAAERQIRRNDRFAGFYELSRVLNRH
jgi:hypothetical protein